METYSYKAIAADGKEKKGTMLANTSDEVASKLVENSLMPVSITMQHIWDKDLEVPFLNRKKKVKSRDMSVFCRQFASILRAGVSVIDALEMLSEQTENKTLRLAITEVQSSVEKGENLADSMRHQPEVFSSLMVNMIAAGESAGNLENSIDRMAVQFEKDAKIKGMVKKALMYPIILCIVAVGVVCVMMMYVIPSFMSMFDELDTSLPIYTVIVINISNFLTGYWYILLVAIIAIVVLYKLYVRNPNGRRNVDKLKLKIPVFGKLITKTACSRFSRTLSTLLQSGMSMIEAIDITANTMDNVLFKEALQKAKIGVGLGLPLSNQLRNSGLFPMMVIHMTSIGEETGNIEGMLNNVAGYYDEEVEITTQQATALMEPMIILVMAVLVAGIVAAIYGPMITLYNTL